MGKKDDEFEFATAREGGVIGTATRTRKLWKSNGTISTIGKELRRQARKYPPELVALAGIKKKRVISFSI